MYLGHLTAFSVPLRLIPQSWWSPGHDETDVQHLGMRDGTPRARKPVGQCGRSTQAPSDQRVVPTFARRPFGIGVLRPNPRKFQSSDFRCHFEHRSRDIVYETGNVTEFWSILVLLFGVTRTTVQVTRC